MEIKFGIFFVTLFCLSVQNSTLFDEFAIKFKKNYQDDVEREYRRQVFSQNMDELQ